MWLIMQYRQIFLLGVITTGLLSGCGRSGNAVVPAFDAGLAYQLTTMAAAQQPRHSGTPGAEAQSKFIADNARKFGARVITEAFEGITPEGRKTFRNVIATIPGNDKRYLIIACHYDAKKLIFTDSFAAANDGASGVGTLLAVIKAVASAPEKTRYSLRFVFFDGEECLFQYGENDGLHGSRYYADKLIKTGEIEKCRAMILADMIGDRDLNIALPKDSDPDLTKLCLQSAEKLGYASHFSFPGQIMYDDHVPFRDAGVPAIDLIDFNYGTNNTFWHTREDSMDKISEESLRITGSVLLQMIYNIE